VATGTSARARRSADGQPPRGLEVPLRFGPPQRRRQPTLIVLGLALMLVAAAVAGALYLRVGNRVPVLAMARTVQAGQLITDQDLVEVRIAADAGARTIPAADRAGVVGQAAATALPEGALLSRAQLAAQPVPAPGLAKVGVVLRPGQAPAEGLTPGERVMVVAARAADAGDTGGPTPGTVLVREARVFEQRGSEASEDVVVTLIVRQQDVPNLVRWGAAGQVGLAVLPASGDLPGAPAAGATP
jgi:SAF domain